jgi:phosphorylase kinase alpha/beta subunit
MTEKIMIHHQDIRRRIKLRYRLDDIHELMAYLAGHRTLHLAPLQTGLYPAAGADPQAAYQSGYGNVWVRDNVYVALAQEAAGRSAAARTAVRQLAAFYLKHRKRFEAIVEGRADPSLPMNRPAVRFDGLHLTELPSKWPHAQNDALGYFLWAYCRFAGTPGLVPDPELLALLPLYFLAIRYWEDEDSGHWEERRKVEASSIGAVVAGIRELRLLLSRDPALVPRFGSREITPDFLDALIEPGEAALDAILPSECVQPDPRKKRRYDAALLFLIYPLEVVDDTMGQRIVDDVLGNLLGEYGIRRYLGDSYWTADYKDKVPLTELTADVSERQEERDALARPGEEAQWCIFDPIVSVIAGRRYLRTRNPPDLDRQVHHLNRSLGQLTGSDCPRGELLCPEAYYLEHGRYVPNDNVPLLWTQANLWLALRAMQVSSGGQPPS